MLMNLMNKNLDNELIIHTDILEWFINPSISYILTKRNNQEKTTTIMGIYDEATDNEYVLIGFGNELTLLKSYEINQSKKNLDMFGTRLESYVLHLLLANYNIIYMNLDFHGRMWNFIDEFIYEVTSFENGLYSYLNYCAKTGIQYETLITHTNWMLTIDILFHFYEIEYRNYEVILYQPIGNQYLLLGTNFDKNNQRYYVVLLLDSEHQIIESKPYQKFDNALNDFNNRFYDLKIKEHKQTEELIQSSIADHIKFLEESGELNS